VTVGIVGNDVGFIDIFFTCAQLSFTDPAGDPCRRQVTADGVDEFAARIDEVAPRLAAVLQGIRERSPDAAVVLVGYLRILPPDGRLLPDRADRARRRRLPRRHPAAAHRDDGRAGGGQRRAVRRLLRRLPRPGHLPGAVHQMGGRRLPDHAGVPVHPNASGMRAVSDLTLTTIDAGVPAAS
jgi:hypothetical protein